MPSPIAVEGAGSRASIAAVTEPLSRVGGTTVVALPAKVTRATLNFGGSEFTNCTAAPLAATSRLGSTSSASMDSEMSMVTTTVARSRGTDTWSLGLAKATVRVSRLRIDRPTATCRSQVRSRGMTRSNMVRPRCLLRFFLRWTSHR